MLPTADERLVREMILQMKLGHVSRSYFQNKFGVDIIQRFAKPLSQLAAEGFLSMDGETIRYSRRGLLQVDTLLHDFFLPEHRDARYA